MRDQDVYVILKTHCCGNYFCEAPLMKAYDSETGEPTVCCSRYSLDPAVHLKANLSNDEFTLLELWLEPEWIGECG